METLIKQIQTVCQSLAYGIYDSVKSFGTLGTQDLFEKNLIVETIAALNRSTPYKEQFIPNHLVKSAVGYTLHWLKFYRLVVDEQEMSNVPEWGKEYTK